MSDFSQMLKYLREREGYSQRELASKLGISASAIGMYESGSRHPDFKTEEAIADFFNVDLNTLRGRSTEHLSAYAALIEAYQKSALMKRYIDELNEMSEEYRTLAFRSIDRLYEAYKLTKDI